MAELQPGGTVKTFPHQKRSRATKTKSFYKECIDSGDSIVLGDYSMGLRASMKEKISNYNLINDIVDPDEVTRVVNPYNIEANFTANYTNYPLANPYINNLTGEERQRLFNPLVTLTSPDLINKKLEDMNSGLNEFVLKQVISEDFNQEQVQLEMQKQAKWAKFSYRDKRERMAEQIVRYGFATQGMKETFSRAFEDLLIAGEEIAISEIIAGEPVLRKGNPLNIYTLRSGDSYKIEDSDIIIEISYVPLGQIIDEYHDYLKDSEIKKLEDGYANSTTTSKLFNRQLKYKDIDLTGWVNEQGGIGEVVTASSKTGTAFTGNFDDQGNIRKVRVLWKGMRKVGVLPYFDDAGDIQKRYIDEDYPLEEEEKNSVKWIWIGEWYEGTKLGEDIYTKMGPRDVQLRSMDNPSKCHPGIVGTAFNVNSNKSKSLLSMMKPYQLMYNYFMHKLWEESKAYKGNLARINLNMIPDGWKMDQFLYYMDQMKIIFEDPFNEGTKGAAIGKLAGHMGNTSSSKVEIGDAAVITQILSILEFIEYRLQDVTGITDQRKGAIQNRETKGGIERSVTQSTLNTGKYYSVHDDFRIRAIGVYLETAKVAWKGQKFKRQFILDDGSQAILDYDSDMFMESEYGVEVTNSSQDMEMMQMLRSLIQPFLQNGGSMAMVMELYRTKDPASLQRKLETYEEEIQRQQAEQAKMQNEQAQAQMQQALQLEQAKLEIENTNNVRDNETKLQIAYLQANSTQEEGVEEDVDQGITAAESEKFKLEEDKLSETIRKNKRAENQKDEEIGIKRKQANKPVATASK